MVFDTSFFVGVSFNLQKVSFDNNVSPAHLAMVIYEWTDVQYLGKITTSETDDNLPVSLSMLKYIYNLSLIHSRKRMSVHQTQYLEGTARQNSWGTSFSIYRKENP